MVMLTLQFLGSFQVKLDDEPITHFRAANNQGLLAYLAMHAGTPHSREVLAALFWPEESTENARNNLRQAVYQLRKLLGDLDKPQRPFIETTRQSVGFNPQSDCELDTAVFLAALDAGDLETAVDSYRGELLPGFTCDSLPFEEWLRLEREQLHRLALAVMGELAQEHLQNGRLPEAQAAARRRLSLEPWNESAHRQLMLAYALSGDRGSALAQYEQCRGQLQQELGIEPEAETETLLEAIKAGRYRQPPEAVLPPPKIKHNLPADTTPLIGREPELSQLRDLITAKNQRLVTISGPGGMGKTRVAIAAGRNLLELYEDGVYFVDLAPLSQADDIITAVATAVDYQAPEDIKDVRDHLLSTLSRRRMLLILDNFEHLLEGAALVDELLRAGPSITILATSRQRLNLASETHFELGGLDYADSLDGEDAASPDAVRAEDYTAVRLFVDNGCRVRPGFTLTGENTSDVLRICRLVEGMPLGLILAASWLELLSPAQIADEIEAGLEILAADLADLPPRQHSMQAIFACSWENLRPDEQDALARLTVFRGGFSREAAVQVAGSGLRVLLSLLNKSLLQRQADGARFSVHELLRQFAAQHLDEESRSDTELSHCRYFAQLVDTEFRRGLGFWPVQLPRTLAADRENIYRAWDFAVDHALAPELSVMARGVAMFGMAQGIDPDHVLRRAVRALQKHDYPDTDSDLLHLQFVALKSRLGQDEFTSIERSIFGSLPLLIEYGDPELRFWAYEQMAHFMNDARDPQAIDMMDHAYRAAVETGDPLLIRMAEAEAIWMRIDQGHWTEVNQAALEEMLAFFEPDYPESFIVYGMMLALSRSYLLVGAYEEATTYGSRGLNIAKGWQDLFWMSLATDMLSTVYSEAGDQLKAAALYADMLEWHLAIGQVWQLLGFIWARASHDQILLSDVGLAASLISMVDHHPEATAFHRQMIMDARTGLEEELGAEAFAAVWRRGSEMELETAVRLLKNALTQS